MSYTPTVWKSGDVVSSLKLNKLENGVAAAAAGVDELTSEIIYIPEKNIEWVKGFCNVGNFKDKAGDMVSKPFILYKGETVSIKTKGDGAYLFRTIAKFPSLDVTIANGYPGGTQIELITVNTLKEYTYTATDDEEYIGLGALDDPTTEVTFSNLKQFSVIDKIEDEIDELQTREIGVLTNKSVMFFGDSLTSASGAGINGFALLIAEAFGMPYKSFIQDSADGNPDDVPIDYPRFTNYAKDGTCNRIVEGRADSVVERVKRHITSDTLIDYVLIECCVNDMATQLQNKGEISESFTAEYDTSTTIGAIEETLRYLTTLGKPIRVGGFIPWKVVWQDTGWFDDYAAVFEKWGVPLFDMRDCAGFNFRDCAVHRAAYSLTSDNYNDYSDSTTYALDALVKYGGSLYKCLVAGTVGIPPTDTTHWMEVSSESYDGTHLNNTGHIVVAGKIQKFLERC